MYDMTFFKFSFSTLAVSAVFLPLRAREDAGRNWRRLRLTVIRTLHMKKREKIYFGKYLYF